MFLNAIQATPRGGTIEVRLQTDSDNKAVTVSVTDNGSGMPKELLSSIFTPYFTTKASGTGLGLAIAQQIMEGYGGSIRVKSEPGAGGTFTLIFPLLRAPKERI